MASCAIDGCLDPACYLCRVVSLLPAVPEACGKPAREKDSKAAPRPCRYVVGHPGACIPTHKKPEREKLDTRDGDPRLAAEKKRGNLAFEKRKRVGPGR